MNLAKQSKLIRKLSDAQFLELKLTSDGLEHYLTGDPCDEDFIRIIGFHPVESDVTHVFFTIDGKPHVLISLIDGTPAFINMAHDWDHIGHNDYQAILENDVRIVYEECPINRNYTIQRSTSP